MTFLSNDLDDDLLPPSIAKDGGPFGPRGPQGERGAAGLSGKDGRDGAAGATGALVKLAEVLLGASAATISFTSIDQTYRTLKLVGRGRMATNASNNFQVLLQFNSDAGANYDWSCGAAGTQGFGDTSILLGQFPLSTDLANQANPLSVEIPYYTDTTWHKTLLGTSANQFGTTAGTLNAGMQYGRWRSTAAITRIDLFCGGAGGTFAAPTVFTLYGES